MTDRAGEKRINAEAGPVADVKTRDRGRPLLLAASVLLEVLIGAMLGWGAFVPMLVDDGFVASAARAQMVFGAGIITFSLGMFLFGRLIHRVSEKTLVVSGSLVYIAVFLAAGFFTGNYAVLLLSMGVLQALAVSAIYISLLQICVRRFSDRAGTATGLLVSGYGLGAFGIAYAVKWLSGIYEAPGVFHMLALLYGLPVLLLGLLVLALDSGARERKGAGRPVGPVRLDGYVLCLAAAMMTATMAGYALLSSMALMVKSIGLSTAAIAPAISLFAVGNSAGRLGWGLVSDAVGSHRALLLSFAIQIALVGLLATAQAYTPLLAVVVLLAGGSFGSCLVLFPARVKDHYGAERVGGIYSVVILATSVSGFLSPLIAGQSYDATGSYLPAMRTIWIVLLLGFTAYTIASAAMGRKETGSLEPLSEGGVER